jgi:ribosomal-protein-alanine N-acetyltransferase
MHRPWIALPVDRATFTRFVETAWSDRRRSFFAFTRDTGTFVGGVDIGEIVRGIFCSAYTGYYGAAGYTGRGYLTEACARLLDYAFGPLRLHRVEANIQPANERSRALVMRCGFRCEGLSRGYLKIGGRWRDHERWAILRDEWRAARAPWRAARDR